MNKFLKDYTFEEIANAILNTCYPYGSETYDEERYYTLIDKKAIVEELVKEIVEAGKLYNRKEHSISRISSKANEYLADLRDWLCSIEYLRETEVETIPVEWIEKWSEEHDLIDVEKLLVKYMIEDWRNRDEEHF